MMIWRRAGGMKAVARGRWGFAEGDASQSAASRSNACKFRGRRVLRVDNDVANPQFWLEFEEF